METVLTLQILGFVSLPVSVSQFLVTSLYVICTYTVSTVFLWRILAHTDR